MSVPLNRYIAFMLRRRWLVLAASVAVMLILAVGLRTIVISNDWRDMLDEGNPQLVAFDAMEATYSATNAAVIAVAPKGGSVFTREALGAIEELTEAAWRVPRATRVDSLVNYNHTEAEEDDLIVERLVDDAGSLSDQDLARIKKIALNESSIVGRLVSRDGRVAGLVVIFALPERSDAAEIRIYNHIRGLLEKSRKAHPDIEYHVTGNVFVNQVLTEAAQDDMGFLAPAAFLVIVAVAAILLRSLFGTLSLVVVVIFTVISAMGVIGWIGLVLNAANSSVPLIIMTLAIAHSVHVVDSIVSGMRGGLDRDAAIAESLRHNAWPVFLTTATTMIGFFSMNASDSPPFRILGNLVAFGMLCAYAYSMTLLPALLSVLPLRARQTGAGGSSLFDRLGAFVVARRTLLLWAVAAVAIALVAGVPRVELTDNWTQHLDERYEFRRDTDFVIENLTGVETLEYSLDSGRESGITAPAYLKKVEAFAEWYRAQPEVAHVQVFTDIMKRLNKNMNGDDPAFYRLPDNSRLAAQYLLLYELSVPFGMDLNNRINVAKSATRMTVTLKRLKSEELRALEARGQKWLGANAPGLAKEGVGLQPHLRPSGHSEHLEHVVGHAHRHDPHFADPDRDFQEPAPGPHQPHAQPHPRGHGFRRLGLSVRRGGARRLSRDRHRLRDCRRRHDSLHEQISEVAPRGPFLTRGGARHLPFGRLCAVLYDHDPGAGFPGVRHVGVRDHLDARPLGCAHARLRAGPGSPAPSAPADGSRP